ncbi:MAG: DUF421 domain-containing protein [Clostridia bacterium]|nr:DUF421 domain-containing protein [Clostridia bacterium]
MSWNDFWLGSKELPFWAYALRAVILYISLIIATRLMRQRQIAILSGHNYLVAAGIVSLAVVRMVNPESSVLSAIVIIFLYAGINIFLSYLDLKIPRQVDRHATILIENGKLIKKNLVDSRITLDNLMGQLRLKSVFSLSEVEYAIVEATGKINVVKKQKGMPVTRKQMNLPFKNISLSTILIYDGKVLENNLKMIGHDTKWLIKKINEKGFPREKDVFLAVLEGDGTLHVSV